MKALTLILAILITVVFASSAMAVPLGKTVEYAGGAQGKVVFDGKIHADKGLKCADCHKSNVPFAMKKGSAKMNKENHAPGKFCGTCHDGKKAFAQDEANCAKCHKK